MHDVTCNTIAAQTKCMLRCQCSDMTLKCFGKWQAAQPIDGSLPACLT